MLIVETPQDLKKHIGTKLGPSDWLTVDQDMIDKFAEATGDHQWIHVDVERAKKEMPGGKTIAQVNALHAAGSELVRVTVNNDEAARAVPEIVEQVQVPVIGDFHYNGHVLLTKYPACAKALAK